MVIGSSVPPVAALYHFMVVPDIKISLSVLSLPVYIWVGYCVVLSL